MQEKICYWLPDAQPGDGSQGEETELVIDPRCWVGSDKNRCERLQQENAGAGQNDIFDGWSDEAAPVEANFRRAERRTHSASVRPGTAEGQKELNQKNVRILRGAITPRLIEFFAREVKQRPRQQQEHNHAEEIVRCQWTQYLRPKGKEIRPPGQTKHGGEPMRNAVGNFRVLQQRDDDAQKAE